MGKYFVNFIFNPFNKFLGLLSSKQQGYIDFEKHLNPVMLVFIG